MSQSAILYLQGLLSCFSFSFKLFRPRLQFQLLPLQFQVVSASVSALFQLNFNLFQLNFNLFQPCFNLVSAHFQLVLTLFQLVSASLSASIQFSIHSSWFQVLGSSVDPRFELLASELHLLTQNLELGTPRPVFQYMILETGQVSQYPISVFAISVINRIA